MIVDSFELQTREPISLLNVKTQSVAQKYRFKRIRVCVGGLKLEIHFRCHERTHTHTHDFFVCLNFSNGCQGKQKNTSHKTSFLYQNSYAMYSDAYI